MEEMEGELRRMYIICTDAHSETERKIESNQDYLFGTRKETENRKDIDENG